MSGGRTSRYLKHLTLDTGHLRRSPRDEVDDAVVTLVRQDLAASRAGERYVIRPGYWLRPSSEGAALLATVMSDADGPLVTMAIVHKSRDSARMWSHLRQAFGAAGDPPAPPWCAVKLHPALAADPGAMEWLGNFERCLAWAWIEPATGS